MQIWKTKTWTPLDIGMLKWSSLLVGVAVGSFFADLAQQYLWLIVIAALALAIKPTIDYFRD